MPIVVAVQTKVLAAAHINSQKKKRHNATALPNAKTSIKNTDHHINLNE